MNVKPKFVYYDIRRKQSACLVMYTHENDVDTQVLEVSMLDNGEPIELDADYTYSAAIVNRDTKALINDNISCELNDSGNVLIPIDNFHTLGAQDLLIELTINDSAGNQVLVTPFPLWIHVNASILDDAQVTPESQGTVPELLEEAKEALENAGDYESLENKPQINGHELVGNKSSDDLGLQGKLTAGENITINANGVISAEGGTDDYNDLENKPSVNGVELRGNKTLSDLKIQPEIFAQTEYFNLTDTADGKQFLSLNTLGLNVGGNLQNSRTIQTSYHMVAYKPWALNYFERGEIPVPELGVYQKFMNEFRNGYQAFYFSYESGRVFRRSYGSSGFSDWQEIELGFQIASAVVNQDGTITFTNSDDSTVTTTGESIIGPQGPAGADGNDYVLTNQDKSDIADLVLAQLPTTQGVQYGNSND